MPIWKRKDTEFGFYHSWISKILNGIYLINLKIKDKWQQVLELMKMHPKERPDWVILTASWFDNINIGYRFHTSTVCHSCCNNVMYISDENQDISGSAWKKCHADKAFLLARIVLILNYTGRELCSPHASNSSQIAARFWKIIYDIYWYLHCIGMIVINVYNNYVISLETKYYDIVVQCTIPGVHIM